MNPNVTQVVNTCAEVRARHEQKLAAERTLIAMLAVQHVRHMMEEGWHFAHNEHGWYATKESNHV